MKASQIIYIRRSVRLGFIIAYPITFQLSFSVKGKRRLILVLGIPFEPAEIVFSDAHSLPLSVFRAAVNGIPLLPPVVHMLSCHVGPWL